MLRWLATFLYPSLHPLPCRCWEICSSLQLQRTCISSRLAGGSSSLHKFRPASSARSESGKGKGDRGADIRPPDLEESDGPYFRALCDTCGTPLGVRDTDEVFHFFNAFPTNA